MSQQPRSVGRLGVFAQMCVAPFVAWRPRSGRPPRSATPNLDGCGAASPGRDTNAGRLSAATADRARYHHELERHGENLASHILHKLRVAPEDHPFFAQGKWTPRQNDADHVRDVQRARHVHVDPDCLVPVRFRMHDVQCDGLWWRRFPHSAHPRRLCSASRHPSFGWPWWRTSRLGSFEYDGLLVLVDHSQANNTLVKERLWIGQLCFYFSCCCWRSVARLRSTSFLTETALLLAPNVSVALECLSSHISPRHFFPASWKSDVDIR